MKKQNYNHPPHGSHVFEEPNCNCLYEVCETKRESVEKMVQSFGQISRDWMKILLGVFGDDDAVPMWGTCFIVRNPCDVRQIKNLFLDKTKEPDEEDCFPYWFSVGETGLLGRELDGEIVLAIDGAGYNFYADHWEPLYDALGYIWHRSPADVSEAEIEFAD